MQLDSDLDKVYDLMDDLLGEGKFSLIDNMLKNMNVGLLKTDIILAYLVNAAAARSKLPSFRDFAIRSIEVFKEREVDERVWKYLASELHL